MILIPNTYTFLMKNEKMYKFIRLHFLDETYYFKVFFLLQCVS